VAGPCAPPHRHVTAIGLAITIIGVPFAWAHLKMIPLPLWPIGQTIVTAEEADLLRATSQL
jgi:uncharacterized membrane protein YccF (DUF307 family)